MAAWNVEADMARRPLRALYAVGCATVYASVKLIDSGHLFGTSSCANSCAETVCVLVARRDPSAPISPCTAHVDAAPLPH